MIWQACTTVHKGQPQNCYGCPCQHKGELYRAEEPDIIGWSCQICGEFLNSLDQDCNCDLDTGMPLLVPVFRKERA